MKHIIIYYLILLLASTKFYSQDSNVKANIEMDFFGNLYIDAKLPNLDIKKDTLIIDNDILIHKNYATLIGGYRSGGSYLIKYIPKINELSYVVNLPKNSGNSYVKKTDYFFTFINYLPSLRQSINKEKEFNIKFDFPNKFKVVYPDSLDLTKKFITTPPIIAGDFIESEIEGFKVFNLRKDNKSKKEIDKVISVVKDAYDFYQIKYPKKKSKPKIIFLPFNESLGGRTIKDVIVFDSSILHDTLKLEKRLIAHEVAHLWWGSYGVRLNNSHVVEGIAEYMSLKYMDYIKEADYVKKSINKKFYHIEGFVDDKILSPKKRSDKENAVLNYDLVPLLFFNIEKGNGTLYDVLSEFYKINDGSESSVSISMLDSFLKKNELSPIISESILPDYFFIEDGDKLFLKGLNFQNNQKLNIEITDDSDVKNIKTYSFNTKINEYIFDKKNVKKIVIDPEYKIIQFSRLNDIWFSNETSSLSKNRYFLIENTNPKVLSHSTKMLNYLFSKNNVNISDLTCEDNLWLIEKIDQLKKAINKNDDIILTGASTFFNEGKEKLDRIDIKATYYSKKDNSSKFIYFYLYYDKSLKYLQNFKLESELDEKNED